MEILAQLNLQNTKIINQAVHFLEIILDMFTHTVAGNMKYKILRQINIVVQRILHLIPQLVMELVGC